MAEILKNTKISLLAAYTDYKNANPKGHKNYLTKKQFNSIIKELGSEYAYECITTGRPVKFKHRLGALQALKYKNNKRKVDFKLTKEIYGEHNRLNPDNKKSVVHTNRTTKGFLPCIWWNRSKNIASFRHKNEYIFRFSRPNLRPNIFNKNNPKVSLIPFFKQTGYRIYPTKAQIK